eukprot:GEMP01026288.1.p1 GENE.GEMP01026288.1~~GEMP01026288.1.p1  ORF type:complete len:184 (-),score=5.51 GEMP01026288.1:196-747(-)
METRNIFFASLTKKKFFFFFIIQIQTRKSSKSIKQINQENQTSIKFKQKSNINQSNSNIKFKKKNQKEKAILSCARPQQQQQKTNWSLIRGNRGKYYQWHKNKRQEPPSPSTNYEPTEENIISGLKKTKQCFLLLVNHSVHKTWAVFSLNKWQIISGVLDLSVCSIPHITYGRELPDVRDRPT